MIQRSTDIVINGSKEKSILIDLNFRKNNRPKQVVIFSHGFKGFKDWGAFNDIAYHFATKDIFFLKFNFSYNGTTIEDPLNFADLDAFGNNNFCIELDDLGLVIDWLLNNNELSNEIDKNNICLLGHSRGGAISILKANEDNRINKIISWSSPADLFSRLSDASKVEKWRSDNVAYVYNGRTKQNMPLYFQFYTNCKMNSKRISLENAIVNSKIPHLVVHGEDDSTVNISDAKIMKEWNNKIRLEIVRNANHVFGMSHPFILDKFPIELNKVIDYTVDFLKS